MYKVRIEFVQENDMFESKAVALEGECLSQLLALGLKSLGDLTTPTTEVVELVTWLDVMGGFEIPAWREEVTRIAELERIIRDACREIEHLVGVHNLV